jgi:RNA-directed DNA polymerase
LTPSLHISSDCQDLVGKLKKASCLVELAELLEVPSSWLRYYLYVVNKSKEYSVFDIRKKSGGVRKIEAPLGSLKIVQRKISQVLYAIHKSRYSSHGYLENRSVKTNALCHTKKKYVLNVDIQDFFGSINFGRVRGVLIAKPYEINKDVATMIAQLCTHENHLPQGSPASPIISNMVCSRLDRHLEILAKKYKCFYTRYSDDITFSTTRLDMPEGLIRTVFEDDQEKKVCGDALLEVIESNGFQVNQKKVRLSSHSQRQVVTGLIVNEGVNVSRKQIREIRSILHSWRVYGLEVASKKYSKKYDSRPKFKVDREDTKSFFLSSLLGKIDWIGYIKGRESKVFTTFRNQYRNLLGSSEL